MSGAPGEPDEPTMLAGEYALGLLDGEALLSARGLIAHDPAFAAAVADWQAHFAPLLDAIDPVVPHPRVWTAIEAALHARTPTPQVIALHRQVRRWRIGTGVAAGLALVLAIVGLSDRLLPPRDAPPPQIVRTAPVPSPVRPAPALAAALTLKGGGTIGLVYSAAEHRLVALAPELAPRKGRDLELWVLPDGSPPLPLGLVAPGDTRRLTIPASLAAHLIAGATVAVSLEPRGGSPTGLPTGPVLAAGKIIAT